MTKQQQKGSAPIAEALTARVQGIAYYPLKGAGGVSVRQTTLAPGRGIRHDRRFGLAFGEDGASAPAAAADKWRPWERFHTLKKTAKFAHVSVAAREDGDALVLRLSVAAGRAAEGRPAVAAEHLALEAFLREELAAPTARLVDCESRPLWDDDGIALTLLNTDSVAALAATENADISPIRFRANIVFSGLPPWREETLTGEARIGGARLRLAGGVPRCAATTVNPETAERDLRPPQILARQRGHSNMGVFAHVIRGGDIAVGEEIHFESA